VLSVRPDAERRRWLGTLALLPWLVAHGAEPAIPRLADLRQAAADVQRHGRPLLLFFTTPGCPYCAEVRRSYLAPRLRDGDDAVTIREVEIVSERRIVGPAGEAITEAQLAARYGVRAVPVVLLVDAGLRPLAEPLVGLNAAFYEAYLTTAIDTAVRALRGR
jgi:glutaredoxin